MDPPAIRVWTWAHLWAFLSWVCVAQAEPGPHYMVAIPAVLEAGAETLFCASLLEHNETLAMTVTLMSQKENMTLMEDESSQDFHTCFNFTVPYRWYEVAKLEVKVKGQTFSSKEVIKVLIRAYQPMTFIQTDKLIYLPGQTVNFRVVSIDNKFRPVSRLYTTIHVQDPKRNMIGQWLNETSDGRILQLYHSLNSEASEGMYRVIVMIGVERIERTFKVEKYVLPKFDIKIESSDEVSIGQEEIRAEVCAKYTYGQPVLGNIISKLCRPFSQYYRSSDTKETTAPCFVETKKADKLGCATLLYKMSDFRVLDRYDFQQSLTLSVKVEEEGTGTTHEQEKSIKISDVIAKLSFIDTPKLYKQGSEVMGKVKAVHYNNTPIPDMSLYLFEGFRRQLREIHYLTTDSEGVAAFTYNPGDADEDIDLLVKDKQDSLISPNSLQAGYVKSSVHKLTLSQDSSTDSKTVCSVEVQKKDQPIPCDTEEDISIKYTVFAEKQGSANVIYVVLSRGAIVKQGFNKIEVPDETVIKGQMSFKLRVSPEIAPVIQVVVYAVLPSGRVIAHSAEFPTEKCFGNKVSLEFSLSAVVPGEENTLKVTAQPDSLCGLSIVDQSVLIKEPGKTLNAEKIFNLLPVTKTTSIPHAAEDQQECLDVRHKKYAIMSGDDNMKDAYDVLKDVGLKMATNLNIRTPTCILYGGRKYTQYKHRHEEYFGFSAFTDDLLESDSFEDSEMDFLATLPEETVRTFFPETWLWDLVETGASGTKVVPLTVPDTITTWETEAFCLSPQGFVLAPREKLTVFQPFFLELSLPYSIIRGENFELKATVFNYLSSCIMVTATPDASLDFTLTPNPEDEYTTCLCGNERKTFRWILTPSTVGDVTVSVSAEAVTSHVSCDNKMVGVPERGRKDTVIRNLKVKAEGIEKTVTSSWLLCPQDETLAVETEILLPADVIEGSSRALVSVLGDILGRALNNLGGLLRMPYGCGEQNMALLAPNIYILQYLRDTNQLTPATREKGANFLASGSQRQLNYKHSDGAYSAFGTGLGHTWLSAFVMRSFHQARQFVFIDPSVTDGVVTWLKSKQQSNGSYTQQGKLFHNEMKGGVSDEVTITAYVTAAFLEMNPTVTDLVSKSLSYLKQTHSDLSNTYATALQAYVFSLARDMETRALLLTHLNNVALKQGDFIHWSQTGTDSSSSLCVEISSYVLLSVLSVSPSAEELGFASSIVRWLTTQQNYYGGFSSTQDTVVALQALALYSTHVFSPEGSSAVTVQSPSSQLDFTVSQENKLLYQEQLLKDVTGRYKVEVTGSMCASVQISHHFNTPPPTVDNTLSVEVDTKANCSVSPNKFSMTLDIKCLYNGERNFSNMAILDVKMLSGFVPHPESLKKLKNEKFVERVEQKGDHVLVYIKELSKDEPISYSLELTRKFPVKYLKAAVIKLYDYYQPSDLDHAQYIYPCLVTIFNNRQNGRKMEEDCDSLL
ncbi:alpha-2-macroglobulin-like isoform X3 [Notolabrus celidotus]|nr:alpha-2-macroglobulin-like isoform X3 [Notolabrus celidotus]XP_034557113.1 alpha-2-macroglobulin-like isoform X3 [Notolabrus celidotus]XP_034557114.1 alpha-2-macroglobulin-like isoform X3 [Notolabrus celidotus]XP_034557115.1 alpha-2-macroglobulin-like isoform X3 [Notolabrus celidotus]XP_034557117.1 alpha-2-macroglobulin-like isoform X3 [Notolabrus celidotus]